MHNSSDWKSFGEEISALVKNRGYSGYFGYQTEKTQKVSDLAVTKSGTSEVTKNSDWLPHAREFGPSNLQENQQLAKRVTKVTEVTNFSDRAERASRSLSEGVRSTHGSAVLSGIPPEWSESCRRFLTKSAPKGFPAHRWEAAQRDAERFLSVWGSEATRLAWTDIDVFGASSAAPWARVGMLGLVPLLNGDAVVELSADAAIIETASGSHLRYRRHFVDEGRICLWEIGEAA